MITRLDSQYRALIDKYEYLLDVYNQTRAPESDLDHVPHVSPLSVPVSLREELSMLDLRVDMTDVMEVSQDILDISAGDEKCDDHDRDEENAINVCKDLTFTSASEHDSESSGFCDNCSEQVEWVTGRLNLYWSSIHFRNQIRNVK